MIFLVLWPIAADFEDCYRVGKSKNTSKKVIARFINRKIVKKSTLQKEAIKNHWQISIGLQNAKIFLNENLTPENNKIAYHCRKLKHDGTIPKTYTSSVENICCNILENGKPQKNHDLWLMIFA